ncbi:XRE family transcriptional regulator [Staphylococcus xylosus]|uniref:helix-turn-helix transcriptional regulator n=1 Tax=Staphylococcus xylosus TaxID=1288 RepID=UPI002DBB45D8|nr:helix-turn-helix transcriptional regulator [Staphylococcus xylosus]MEB8122978.1 XRE family transcriptional regulator [Staphylococcus xylosus]
MNNSTIIAFIRNLSLEIRGERKRKNISTNDAAHAINLHSSTYSKLENDPLVTTSLLKFSHMIEALDVSVSNVLKRVYFIQQNSEQEIDIDHKFVHNFKPESLIKEIFLVIREERKSKGASQRVIADKIKMHKRYYSDIENGKANLLSLYRFIEISEALEVPLYVLVERAEQSLVEKGEYTKE